MFPRKNCCTRQPVLAEVDSFFTLHVQLHFYLSNNRILYNTTASVGKGGRFASAWRIALLCAQQYISATTARPVLFSLCIANFISWCKSAHDCGCWQSSVILSLCLAYCTSVRLIIYFCNDCDAGPFFSLHGQFYFRMDFCKTASVGKVRSFLLSVWLIALRNRYRCTTAKMAARAAASLRPG